MKRLWMLWVFVVILPPGYSPKVSSWTLLKDKNNIQVYCRSNSLSPIKEIKVETLMNTTQEKLITIIKDIEHQCEWVYANIDARMLEESDEQHWVSYTLSDAPWPVSDRYVIADVELTRPSDSMVNIVSTASKRYPDYNKEAVRVPYLRSVWHIEKRGSAKVFVCFQILLKLGGKVPAWVVNLFIDNGPYNSMYNLKQRAEQKKKP